MTPSEQVNLRIGPEMIEKIDEARGVLGRTIFMRAVLTEYFEEKADDTPSRHGGEIDELKIELGRVQELTGDLAWLIRELLYKLRPNLADIDEEDFKALLVAAERAIPSTFHERGPRRGLPSQQKFWEEIASKTREQDQ